MIMITQEQLDILKKQLSDCVQFDSKEDAWRFRADLFQDIVLLHIKTILDKSHDSPYILCDMLECNTRELDRIFSGDRSLTLQQLFVLSYQFDFSLRDMMNSSDMDGVIL